MNKRQAFLTAALGGILMAGASINGATKIKDHMKADKGKMVEGKCMGVNACKGKGDCGGKSHECAGKNACKGKGWNKMSKADCVKQKGKFVKS